MQFSYATIVVSGNVLRTSNISATEIVEHVVILQNDNEVFSSEGCGKNYCLVDVTNMPNGTYVLALQVKDTKTGLYREVSELVIINK